MPKTYCAAPGLARLLDGSTAGELLPELARYGLQGLIELEASALLGAERLAGWDPLLNRHVGEQGAAVLPVASHLRWALRPFSRDDGVFQRTLKRIESAAVVDERPRGFTGAPFGATLRSPALAWSANWRVLPAEWGDGQAQPRFDAARKHGADGGQHQPRGR
jgi:hypothetical protein